MELKQLCAYITTVAYECLNRTFMELKLQFRRTRLLKPTTRLNRTFMELKQIDPVIALLEGLGLNRTFMELKRAILRARTSY